MASEDRQFQKLVDKFKEDLKNVLGDAIRRPISARLGYKNDQGEILRKVPQDRTDQPNKYYFHEAGGTQFQGEAWLQPSALSPWQRRYNAPIRIKKDPLSGEWEIVGVDSRYAEQFFDGVSQDDGVIYPYSKLAPGLLTTTIPLSMTARVLPALYRLSDSSKYFETLKTIDWGEAPHNSNIPTRTIRARYVLVQVDFANDTLGYKYGLEFPSAYSFRQVLALDGNSGTYIPQPDTEQFSSGYIKLQGGMTEISQDNIIPLQQYVTLTSEEGVASALDSIVTDGGSVVVDSETGNVVYALSD